MDNNETETETTVVADETTVVADETTTSGTETEKKTKKKTKTKKKEKGPSYPFRSKKAIVEQVESDDDFLMQCLSIVAERSAAEGKRQGFMSSHKARGTAFAGKLAEDQEFTPEEKAEVRTIVRRYGRQLAEHFRQEQIASNPELEEVAKIFSAN